MEKDRQTKIIAIAALFIGVATLTLGFATFSARLIIQPKAKVTPDADSFKVLLSKEQNSVVDGRVSPTGDGEDATINNSEVPTISNLKANFVNPGEKVVYEFYAVNSGDLDAFLNKIDFTNITSKATNKVCTAGENTTDSYVQSACESIRVTVKVGTDDKACQTSTYNSHKLEKKSGEKVVVTIEYNKEGVRADGPFSVEFGDIMLNYSTVDSEGKNVPTCDDFGARPVYGLEIKDRTNIIDNDNDGMISFSDKVTLGTESFYVMSVDETSKNVTMLAEWNLNVGNKTVAGTIGIQNSLCKAYIKDLYENEWKCTLPNFANNNYWSSEVSTYPTFVYDERSTAYQYLADYEKYMKNAGFNSVKVTIPSYEKMSTVCNASSSTCKISGVPLWVYQTSYWTGTAGDSKSVAFVSTVGYFGFVSRFDFLDPNEGLRPVIEISAAEI